MGFLRFLSRHAGASVVGAAGLILMVLGYADQADDIWAAAEPWQLQGLGAALFVVAIILILYKWDQENQRRLSQPRPRDWEPPLSKVSVPLTPKADTISKDPQPRPVEGSKVFVGEKVTANYLMDSCRDKTAVHAAALIKPFVGKWLRVSGVLKNVSQSGYGSYVSLGVPYQYGMTTLDRTVWLSFKGDQERLEVMHKGDELKAIGRIESVRGASIELVDCELLD